MSKETNEDNFEVYDSNGNLLVEGDTVLITKDLKVKGGGTLKKGTKIKNIRLSDDAEGVHGNADSMKGLSIRAEYVKKA